MNWSGALLINKPAGISSFGVIEALQRTLCEERGVRKRDLPKLGHGGTLDPFATGLLIVCVGRGVKLARYFLGSVKTYEGVIRFGETTVPGDPTDAVSERSDVLPESLEKLRSVAGSLCAQPYLQTPPMHSAKKVDGKPLYELARQGIEIDREAKACTLYEFRVLDFATARATVRVKCSSGTYIRVLAQDFARLLGTVGMLDSLHRVGSGAFNVSSACAIEDVSGEWDELSCWIPFDRMLESYPSIEASEAEALALQQGRQNIMFDLLRRAPADAAELLTVYCRGRLVAIARQEADVWGIERVFVSDGP